MQPMAEETKFKLIIKIVHFLVINLIVKRSNKISNLDYKNYCVVKYMFITYKITY